MKSKRAATSRKETPRYNGRDVAHRARKDGKTPPRYWAQPRRPSKPIITRAVENTNCSRSRRESSSAPMASVEVVDLREDFSKTHQTSPISAALHAGIQECLAQKNGRPLVLINRRGYSWSVLCRSCGASVQCENCSISMTHHKQRNRLECQLLRFAAADTEAMPQVANRNMFIFFGEGSEHLEETLAQRISRWHASRAWTATPPRTKRQFSGKPSVHSPAAPLDILVGTQMLAKGHDFSARNLGRRDLARIPRSACRTFRAAGAHLPSYSRKLPAAPAAANCPGRVLIQTYYPETLRNPGRG